MKQYMGRSPKENPSRNKVQPKRTIEQNYNLPVVHGCSSPLLTPTSWWSSQKRVPHSRTHNNESRV